ncbi:MAG: nucleotidyltransferase family protein [Marinicella sp.]
MKINGLILAAGNSSRLGQPKQLLQHQNKSLLALIEENLLACCDQVFVVLGCTPQLFKSQVKMSQVIINQDWKKGLGNSLALGSKIASQNADGLLIALVDQPLITKAHYQNLVDKFHQHPQNIITSEYQNCCGVPAVFSKLFFTELSNNQDACGAKNIIRNNAPNTLSIDCDAAAFDIDLEADLSRLD